MDTTEIYKTSASFISQEPNVTTAVTFPTITNVITDTITTTANLISNTTIHNDDKQNLPLAKVQTHKDLHTWRQPKIFTVKVTTNISSCSQGLIIGLSVGIPCGVALIIALAVAIFCFFRNQEKPQIQIEERESNNDGFYYNTVYKTDRPPSNNYDDVAVPSRSEPVYDTVLSTYSPVYEVALPKER